MRRSEGVSRSGLCEKYVRYPACRASLWLSFEPDFAAAKTLRRGLRAERPWAPWRRADGGGQVSPPNRAQICAAAIAQFLRVLRRHASSALLHPVVRGDREERQDRRLVVLVVRVVCTHQRGVVAEQRLAVRRSRRGIRLQRVRRRRRRRRRRSARRAQPRARPAPRPRGPTYARVSRISSSFADERVAGLCRASRPRKRGLAITGPMLAPTPAVQVARPAGAGIARPARPSARLPHPWAREPTDRDSATAAAESVARAPPGAIAPALPAAACAAAVAPAAIAAAAAAPGVAPSPAVPVGAVGAVRGARPRACAAPPAQLGRRPRPAPPPRSSAASRGSR